MPRYDFKCDTCEEMTEEVVPYEDRNHPLACSCGGLKRYQFPMSAALGFQPQEAYYDQALGHDVNGRREKQQALKSRGLVETGDRVGGARYEETSTHANLVKPQKPRGITLSDVQRATDENQKRKLSKPLFAQRGVGENRVQGRATRNGIQMVINGKRVKGD